MKARVKAIFTFDIYVNGEYSNEASYIKGDAMTLKQAVTEAKKRIRNFSANHVQIFLTAGSLAVADVTMFNREITVNDYNQDYKPNNNTAPSTSDTMNTETKTITVKRSDWNETAKRLECAGWYYIGTPTATGKTIYRRGNSEIEIIIEEDTPTETEKEEKTIEVEIYHDGDTCNAMAGGEKPVIIGWVDRWFNNTFAAGMQFGIKARKAIAIEELTGRDRAHHGFMNAENAKLWLVDQIKDYFRDHGYNLKVVNL